MPVYNKLVSTFSFFVTDLIMKFLKNSLLFYVMIDNLMYRHIFTIFSKKIFVLNLQLNSFLLESMEFSNNYLK